MAFADELDGYVRYLDQVQGRSPNTVRSYRTDVASFLHLMDLRGITDLNDVDLPTLRSWLAHETRSHARSTMARKTAAIRSFFAYLADHGQVEVNPAQGLKTPKQSEHLPRILTGSQAEQLMDRVDSAPVEEEPDEGLAEILQLRDAAMLELLYATGMRVAELCGLDLADLNRQSRTVKVLGKGRKERVVPYGLPAERALDGWMERGRPELVGRLGGGRSRRGASPETDRGVLPESVGRNPGGGESGGKDRTGRSSLTSGDDAQALFLGARGRRIGQRQVRQVVHEAADRAQVPDIAPHALRHTAATQMLDGGADLREVQEMLGHSSLRTTQRYTHVSIEQLRQRYRLAFPRA